MFSVGVSLFFTCKQCLDFLIDLRQFGMEYCQTCVTFLSLPVAFSTFGFDATLFHVSGNATMQLRQAFCDALRFQTTVINACLVSTLFESRIGQFCP